MDAVFDGVRFLLSSSPPHFRLAVAQERAFWLNRARFCECEIAAQ